MKTKEIREIKRRMAVNKNNVHCVYGCFVNSNGEKIAKFQKRVGIMDETEAELIFEIFKKAISGKTGKNLVDVPFTTQQVVNSEEHKLLVQLQKSLGSDEDALDAFYDKIIGSLECDTNYAILLTGESYDVPFKKGEDSDEVFSYIISAICPIKLNRNSLIYSAEKNNFVSSGIHNTLLAPEIGIMFPAFDDRKTNLYGALLSLKHPEYNHPKFQETVFGKSLPDTPATQKGMISHLLETTLKDSCNANTVLTMYEQLCDRIVLQKEAKRPDESTITLNDIKDILASCSVSDEYIRAFEDEYKNCFGADRELHTENIVNEKRLDVVTNDVEIRVNGSCSNLVQTRVIGGEKYILISANDNVSINGVNIQI